MADPVTLATIGIGATVAGGATGALGSILGGQSQAKMYNYQAGVAQTNAALATQDANYAQVAGEVEAQSTGLRGRQQIGATKVGFGAGNVAGASTQRVLGSEVEIAQENQGVVRANAAKRAYGFNVKASEDVAQAGADVAAGENSLTAGDISAGSTILGTIGSVSSKWSQAKQAGIDTNNNNNYPIYGPGY